MERRSTFSSSAISMGSDVYTPWPISDRAVISVTMLSSEMCTHAFGVRSVPAACALRWATMEKPTIRPPVIAAVVLMKSRREGSAMLFICFPLGLGGAHGGGRILDGRANAVVGAAAAHVAAHRGVDVGIARVLVLRQQRRGAHQLA